MCNFAAMKKEKVQLLIVLLLLVALAGVAYHYMPHDGMQRLYNWYKDNMSYGVITLLMAIESSIIPLPSEVVVPPAAYFSLQADSELNFWLVILFATIGALLGSIINYGLSMIIGRPLFYKFADSRWGKVLMLSSEKLQHTEEYFKTKGAKSIFFGRLLPAVRHLISIPAGLSRMHFPTFVLYTTLGAALWNIVLAALGYLLFLAVPDDSQFFEQLQHYNHYLKIAGYTVLSLIIAYFGYKWWKNRKNKSDKTTIEQ